MSAVGLGDLRILLSQYFATVGAVEFSGAVVAGQDFGGFVATVTGTVGILISVDDISAHLAMADKTLDDVYRGVDDGRFFPSKQWQVFKSIVVSGHQYAFQLSASSASTALVVTYAPLSV